MKCREDLVVPLVKNTILDHTHLKLIDLDSRVLGYVCHINRMKPVKLATPAGYIETCNQLIQTVAY